MGASTSKPSEVVHSRYTALLTPQSASSGALEPLMGEDALLSLEWLGRVDYSMNSRLHSVRRVSFSDTRCARCETCLKDTIAGAKSWRRCS